MAETKTLARKLLATGTQQTEVTEPAVGKAATTPRHPLEITQEADDDRQPVNSGIRRVQTGAIKPAATGPPILDGYLTRQEAAAEFGVVPRTISEWVAMPDGLPFLMLGRCMMIPRDGARGWVASRIRVRNRSPKHRGK